jgi:putative endonuclease
MNNWYVYLVRCSDSSLYCGVTTDLDRRVQEHNDGKGSRYTLARRPVRLVWTSKALSKSKAYKDEFRLKRMRKDAKEALVTEEQRRRKPLNLLDRGSAITIG